MEMGSVAEKAVDGGAAPYYVGAAGDERFVALVAVLQRTLERAVEREPSGLFLVESCETFERYLSCFDGVEERQHHHCTACRRFLALYGRLVIIDAQGRARSAVWDAGAFRTDDDVPGAYFSVVSALEDMVRGRKVVARFYESSPVWGTPTAGGFSHFALKEPSMAYRPREVEGQTARQAMKESCERYVTLDRSLSEMSEEAVRKAVAMLEAGELPGQAQLLPMGHFVKALQLSVRGVQGFERHRLVWRAVGQAPVGWCNPRGSAFGALVADVARGRSFEAVARSQSERMRGDRYQRPQAAPTAGNVAEAERLVEKLGLARSLERRFLALSEAQTIWQPPAFEPERSADNGVFASVRTKDERRAPEMTERITSTPVMMTWAKFRRDVLPVAKTMRTVVPSHGNFCALTGAVHPEAKPILAWDRAEDRNSASWYIYVRGSAASQWGLDSSRKALVVAISELPPRWVEPVMPLYESDTRALFVLEGAKDSGCAGLGLFPATLSNALHAARATIEAFSNEGRLAPAAEGEPHAAGLLLSNQSPVIVEVETGDGRALYHIDRLE